MCDDGVVGPIEHEIIEIPLFEIVRGALERHRPGSSAASGVYKIQF